MIPKLLLYWAMPATALHLVTATLVALQQTPVRAAPAPAEATVNTPRLPIAPDAAADTLLVRSWSTFEPLIRRFGSRRATPPRTILPASRSPAIKLGGPCYAAKQPPRWHEYSAGLAPRVWDW
jgi:hypothetical protein